jgi:hypothetical protein
MSTGHLWKVYKSTNLVFFKDMHIIFFLKIFFLFIQSFDNNVGKDIKSKCEA